MYNSDLILHLQDIQESAFLCVIEQLTVLNVTEMTSKAIKKSQGIIYSSMGTQHCRATYLEF